MCQFESRLQSIVIDYKSAICDRHMAKLYQVHNVPPSFPTNQGSGRITLINVNIPEQKSQLTAQSPTYISVVSRRMF